MKKIAFTSLLALTALFSANAQKNSSEVKEVKAVSATHVVIKQHIDFQEALAIYANIPNRRMEKISLTQPKSLSVKEVQHLVVQGKCPSNAVILMDLRISYYVPNRTTPVVETRQLTCSRGTLKGEWRIQFNSDIPDLSKLLSVDIGVKGYATVNNELMAASTNRISIPVRKNDPIATEKLINDQFGGKKLKKIPSPKGNPVQQ